MAARLSLDKISEEVTVSGTLNGKEEMKDEAENVLSEVNETPKEKKARKGRKVSLFSKDSNTKQFDKAMFMLVHIDQPSNSRVTFAVSQSDSSEHSGRRASGQDHYQRLRSNVTYQTGPRKEFSVHQVQKVIRETFENCLNGNEITLPRNVLCKNLTEAIKMKTRRLNYDRYRLIVHVYLCSKENVTLKVTSRCIWDAKVDNYADCKYEAKDFYVMGIVYGVYKE